MSECFQVSYKPVPENPVLRIEDAAQLSGTSLTPDC